MYKYRACRQWQAGVLPETEVLRAHTDVITCLELTDDNRVITGPPVPAPPARRGADDCPHFRRIE